jgi:acyl-CoA synthetase (AMP-forming)/AMP-acid ligase II
MLSHRNVMHAVTSTMVESEPREHEISLVAFPLCHVAGYTLPATHLRGGTSILAPAFEPGNWMELVDTFGVTGTALAPTMVDMILRHPEIDRYSLASLEIIGYGAAAMPVELLRRAMDRFGPILQSGFGMTELSGNVLVFRKQHHVRAVEGEEHLLASCGVPMSLADVMVVDDDFRECSPGEVGEIVVRSDQVLTGYFRNPEASQSSFCDGWFRTGDLARRDDEGFFYIVDRKKDMIITSGFNVYPQMIERAIGQHGDVEEVLVIGIPDPVRGEAVKAFVTLSDGAPPLDLGQLRAFLKDRLGPHELPVALEIRGSLPRTPVGKLSRLELKRQEHAAYPRAG